MSDDKLLSFQIEQLTVKVSKLETEIEQTKQDGIAREHSRLMWGIGTLGTVVTTLGGIIWSYRGVIFK